MVVDATAALESNLWSMWRQFGLGKGCVLVDEDELLRFETPIPQAPYNAVLRFRPRGDPDAAIRSALQPYRVRGVDPVWVVHPTARPDDLRGRLQAHGLERVEVVTGMIAELARVPAGAPMADGIALEEVEPSTSGSFIDLISWRYDLPRGANATLRSVIGAARFGMPGSPNRAWVARRGGESVAKATLHLDGAVAGLYGVATRPEARRHGLARALTLHALAEARRSGAETAVLHSTPVAVGLYLSVGFEPVADFELFAFPDTLEL